jgi:hypothetical protein
MPWELSPLVWVLNFHEFSSEWLLVNTNSAIFQLYCGENKLFFKRWEGGSHCSRPTCLVWYLSQYMFYVHWSGKKTHGYLKRKFMNHISDAICSVFASRVLDLEFEPWSGQTKTTKLGIFFLNNHGFFSRSMNIEHILT